MPRKRPFSAKQKKKQLQDKRERKRGLPDGVRSSSNSRSGSHERREDQTDTSDSESLSLHVRKLNQQPAVRRLGERSYDPNRYRLHFERESREELERRKKVAQEKILEPVPESEKELDIQDVYRSGSVLDFPKRPPWSYQMSKEQLLLREEKCFRDYLEGIYSTYQPSQLSYFEHNLETWRQLWRVLEMSDIILLITDVRHPPSPSAPHQVINFSPALYDFVTKEMRKNLILVLNKIDLAPPGLVVAWKHYFQTRFPQVHIVCFTSYPQQSQDPSTVFKKRRKRRKGRSTAMGPEQLLHACETITAGKVDLGSWKEKIERDAASARLPAEASEEEEGDDEGAAVVVEHLTDVAMDAGAPSQEPCKDGVLTVGCVGFPNVGKSSLMNGLVGHKVVSVSRTPGHTKYFQTYFLTPTVRLCDCPGLIFPSLVHRELQPGPRNAVTRRPKQLVTTCTELPTASCGWRWTGASASVCGPPATPLRKPCGSTIPRQQRSPPCRRLTASTAGAVQRRRRRRKRRSPALGRRRMRRRTVMLMRKRRRRRKNQLPPMREGAAPQPRPHPGGC
nr:guanine nucleotide-binding protein-like 1 isoform X4 [Caretta caretta]